MNEPTPRSASPFVDSEFPVTLREESASWPIRSESPFTNEYALEGEDESSDALSSALAETFAELHDEEFDTAAQELVDELNELVPTAFEAELSDAREAARAEHMLREAVEPIALAAEAFVDEASERLGALDERQLTQQRVLEVMAEIEPEFSGENPAFDQFLGSLTKKIGKFASGALGKVKNLALKAAGPILKALLAKVRPHLRTLLDKVLKFALNKVPVAYRPLAQGLLDKLQGKVTSAIAKVASGDSARPSAATPTAEPPAEPSALAAADTAPLQTSDAAAPSEPASADVGQLQEEIDRSLLELLVADEGEFMNEAPARAGAEWRDHPSAELSRARERFVQELDAHIERGELPGPAIENFLPALMVAAQGANRIFGRNTVVNAIAGIVEKLIKPLIGKQAAPMLSKLLVDIGMRTFLKAEVSEEEAGQGAASQALATTIEETVRTVAQAPSHVFQNQELLEQTVQEAFETAAAANFPGELMRPELREWEGPGMWVSLPLRGRKLFKKYSHVFDVTLPADAAHAISTFGGGSLGGYLRDCLRVSGREPVRGRVHLYECIPTTRLGHIARHEGLRGLVSRTGSSASLFHPLHPQAALALLHAPRLGRDMEVEEEALSPALGQRLYYLEVPAAPGGAIAHPSHLHATVNVPKGEISVCLYLSEALAQRAATMLRSGKAPAAVAKIVRAELAAHSKSLAGERSGRRLRIVLGGTVGAVRRGLSAHVARGVRQSVRRTLGKTAAEWLWQAFCEQLRTNSAAFLAATDGPEDGVRISVRFHEVPGLSTLRSALGSGTASASFAFPPASTPRTTLTMHAGPKHD